MLALSFKVQESLNKYTTLVNNKNTTTTVQACCSWILNNTNTIVTPVLSLFLSIRQTAL